MIYYKYIDIQLISLHFSYACNQAKTSGFRTFYWTRMYSKYNRLSFSSTGLSISISCLTVLGRTILVLLLSKEEINHSCTSKWNVSYGVFGKGLFSGTDSSILSSLRSCIMKRWWILSNAFFHIKIVMYFFFIYPDMVNLIFKFKLTFACME